MNYRVEIAEKVGVSKATIRNWEKSSFIPTYNPDQYKDFSEYSNIVLNLVEKSNKLKSRVNRKKNTSKLHQSLSYLDNAEFAKEVVAILDLHKASLEQKMFEVCLWASYSTNLIELALNHDEVAIVKNNALANFLFDWQEDLSLTELSFWKYLYKEDYPLLESDDFIGRIYEVMQSLGSLSVKGAFFTPASLIKEDSPTKEKTVLDPCAGTGTLLKHYLSTHHNPSNVFLGDVDKVALQVAVVNFAIYFGNSDVLVNISQRDFVNNGRLNYKVDEIYTNPPWGYKYSVSEKKSLRSRNALLDTSESFSHVVFNAMESLKANGIARFILPESITNVKTHEGIRKYLLNHELSITSYEKAFKGVMSNVVHLEVCKGKTPNTTVNSSIISGNILSKNKFVIPKVYNDIENNLISKVYREDKFNYLDSNIVFGLGVVTGNNEKFISDLKSDCTSKILTAKSLKQEGNSCSKYLDLSKGTPQQMAPVEYYRSKKLIYKFISNKLQFKYDAEGHFILNNLNFVIVEGVYKAENLVAYFNSPIANFLHARLNNSIKVLKSHLLNLPIPRTINQENFDPRANHFDLSEEELDYVNRMFG